MTTKEEVNPIPPFMINPATGRAIRTDSNRNRALLNLPLIPTRPRGRPRKRPRTETPVPESVTDHDSDDLSRKSADEVEPEPDGDGSDNEDDDVSPADVHPVNHDDEMVHGLLQETYEAESVAEEPVAEKPVAKPVKVAHYQVKQGPGLRGLYFPPEYSKRIQNTRRE